MKLDVLTREQVEQVRQWRNEERQFLRTPYFITKEMQADFYDNVISNRDSKHRYYAIVRDGDGSHAASAFIGMGGLTNIEWENGRAEISLIINPEYRNQGHGKEAVRLLLAEGFDNMSLETVWGEVYYCGNVRFWQKLVDAWGGDRVDIPWTVKRWGGETYGSMMFAFYPSAKEPLWSA